MLKTSQYIMDNHRAALWCWLQELDKEKNYDFFHLDRHFDARPQRQDDECGEFFRHISGISIQNYLERHRTDHVPLISWDNYIEFFVKYFGTHIDQWFFATHNDGEPPHIAKPESINESPLQPEDIELLKELESIQTNEQLPMTKQMAMVEALARQNHLGTVESLLATEGSGRRDIGFWEIIDNLNYWLNGQNKWIVNIELEYFVINGEDEARLLVFTDKYIETFFRHLKSAFDAGHIQVLTVALSPEFCGGWDQAKSLCKLFTDTFGLHLTLSTE